MIGREQEKKKEQVQKREEFDAFLAPLDTESRYGLPLVLSLHAAHRTLNGLRERIDQLRDACALRCYARTQLRACVKQLYAHLAYYVRPPPETVHARATELHKRTMDDPAALDRLDTALDQAMLYGTLYEGDPSDPGQPLGPAFPSEMAGVEAYGYKGEWIRYVAELIPENAFRDGLRVAPLSVFGYLWARDRLQDKLGASSTPSVAPNSHLSAPAVLPMAAVNWRDDGPGRRR